MASPVFPETELLRTAGNQLNHSDMARLTDGRVVSVGQSIRDVLIRLTDPATGEVVELDPLRGDDLRGAEHNGLTRVVHSLHETRVAALSDGGFVVAAQLNQNIDGSFSNYEQIVYLQFYNADGSPRGEAIRGLEGRNMSTQPGTLDLLEIPDGIILATKGSARFLDSQGTVLGTQALHSGRGSLPTGVVAEDGELQLAWYENSSGSPLFPRDFVPAALVHQRFALDGTPLNDKTRIDNGPGGEQMKLLQTPDGMFKLLYIAIAAPLPGDTILTNTTSLFMAGFDAAMNSVGDPVRVLAFDDAPGGIGRWAMKGFDAVLDGAGGITVALVTDTMEEAGQTDTREDVYVAGFTLDGDLRSPPVLASEGARGIQQAPVLVVQDDDTLFLQFMQFERPEISGATQLIGVQITPDTTMPEPEPEPEPQPLPDPGPDFGLAIAVQLTLPGGRDPAGVVVTFTSDDGETLLSVSASADGAYRLDVAPDVAGRLTATKAWDPATDPGISAADALEALRMAVGLAPSFGAAAAQNFIAADIDGDGSVTASDALEILRAAVGLDSMHAPRWVFVDPAVDLSGVSAGQVSFEAGIAVSGLGDLGDVSMVGILLGSLVNQT